MNIAQIKLVSWTIAGLLLLGLSFFVWDFLMNRYPGIQQPIDTAKVKAVLDSVEPARAKSDDGLAYKDAKRLFADLNWTGKVVKVQETLPDKPVSTTPQVTPVKDLVRILMVNVDTSNPKGSSLFFKYKQKAGVANNTPNGGFTAREGDHLAAPHNNVRIDAIRVEGIVFAFEGSDRATETVPTEEFDSRTAIVKVGPDGVVMPSTRTMIPRSEGEPFRPGKTTAMGPNRFKLGTDDAKYIADNFSGIFAREISTAQHRDPNTGKYDGVEIKSVAPGSMAESHGAQSGDVIKSINGHPVNSVQEAITFVKNNANNYSTWEVVIENKGKTRTVTYESPNH